jgi:hypothetical protein
MCRSCPSTTSPATSVEIVRITRRRCCDGCTNKRKSSRTTFTATTHISRQKTKQRVSVIVLFYWLFDRKKKYMKPGNERTLQYFFLSSSSFLLAVSEESKCFVARTSQEAAVHVRGDCYKSRLSHCVFVVFLFFFSAHGTA